MNTKATGRVLIEIGLPDFLPVGLTVAVGAPHRRAKSFHA